MENHYLTFLLKNKKEAYEAIIEMSRYNDYIIGNLLNYQYFSKHLKLIAIDLSKQIEFKAPDYLYWKDSRKCNNVLYY